MIRLTDEEIMDLVTDYHFSGKQNRHILAESAAKAQLKKIVEFIGGVFSEAKWQALLEEVKE